MVSGDFPFSSSSSAFIVDTGSGVLEKRRRNGMAGKRDGKEFSSIALGIEPF
jgi:hypothetical protein